MQTDKLTQILYGSLKRGITVCLDNQCFGSAIILLYSAIDTMAFLAMPETKVESTREDFKNWCDRYLRIPGPHTVTSEELYSARCAVVHTYGIESSLTRKGKGVRKIGYSYLGDVPVYFDPRIDPNFVVLSLDALSNAFFVGMDQAIVDLFVDGRLPHKLVEARAKSLLLEIPFEELDRKSRNENAPGD